LLDPSIPAVWILQGGADIMALLGATGLISRIVLLVLLMFSIGSWSVILSKLFLFRKIRQESEAFWKVFEKAQSLPEIRGARETLRLTPLMSVFEASYEMIDPAAADAGHTVQTQVATITMVERVLHRASAAQMSLLETRMTLLATTAAVTPFIGLFGTVWGVMGSFAGLGNNTVTTLNAVGPGIAEALIATAAGLFSAIPAVVAYNSFVAEIRRQGRQLDDLQAELLAIAERNGLGA
jgi:biopolymer transport protein TolQ